MKRRLVEFIGHGAFLAFLVALAIPTMGSSSVSRRRSGSDAKSSSAGAVVEPRARAETEPVPHARDAADDPAIWLHPSDPERSLILGTDKKGGLHVYKLDGSEHQLVSNGSRPNNVDVLYNFRLGRSTVDLAVASCRGGRVGVKVWVIDPASGTLSDATAGGAIPVFSGGEPYGLCTYRSPRSGRCYFFVTGKSGAVEQFVLEDAGGGKIGGARVRGFKLGSAAEGCVADHELGNLYVAEENVGIWKFDAEPETRRAGTLVAKVGDHGLRSDVEGLDIYYASGGRGYLIATSQGNDSFKVYAREGINRFLLTIDPRADVIDDAEDTDGIAVTNRPTSWRFPKGLLVVQDGHDEGGTQNFHLYPWEEIAGTRLLVDTARSPRGAAAK